jgi:probable rRNA maturation factor
MQPKQDLPEILVEVSIPYQAWSNDDRRPSTSATRAVKESFARAELPEVLKNVKSIEVSVLLANDDLVRTLNREYLGKDEPTNVLSFPQFDYEKNLEEQIGEEPVNIGDIILAFETVQREAEEKLIPIDSHFMHLMVHGTLHLLGYNHQNEEEATVMENTEIWIMSRMGCQNPYVW